jgi:hypothetical protein
MRTTAAVLLTVLGAFTVTVPAAAHHSFSAEFDADAPIELTGVVTKVEWMNPHTFFYIDVEGENGEYQNWALELGSPNGLTRRGWTRNSLEIGDEVTVTGSRARDGSLKGNARSVVLADGKRLFNGQNEDS